MNLRCNFSESFTFVFIAEKLKKGSRITPDLTFLLNVAISIFNDSINITLVNN